MPDLAFDCNEPVILPPPPAVSDNCDDEILIGGCTITDASGTVFPCDGFDFQVGETVTVCYTAVDDCDNPAEECYTVYVRPCPSETAYGFLAGRSECFITDPLFEGTSDKWGWRTLFNPGETFTQELWMGAAQCNTDNGELVGYVTVSYIGTTLSVYYNMDDDYSLTATHTFVGCLGYPYPELDGAQSVSPGQYTDVSEGLDFYDGYTVSFVVDGINPVHVHTHAMANVYIDGDDTYPGPTGLAITCEDNKEKSAEIQNPSFEESTLKVYPNPFSDKVTFEFVSGRDAYGVLELYNITGQKVARILDRPVEAGVMNRVEYTPEHKVSGMYIYRLDLDGELQIGRIIYKE